MLKDRIRDAIKEQRKERQKKKTEKKFRRRKLWKHTPDLPRFMTNLWII